MAELTSQKVGQRSLFETAIDRVWRFFCSVRAAIYEIAFLALLVLIGTLRGSSVPRNIADLFPFTESAGGRWYDWDVFKSLAVRGDLHPARSLDRHRRDDQPGAGALARDRPPNGPHQPRLSPERLTHRHAGKLPRRPTSCSAT